VDFSLDSNRSEEETHAMENLTIDDAQRDRMIGVLKGCSLFRALKPEHFPQILKVAQALRYDDDEVVIQQGDPSDAFFVVIEGEASIQVQGPAGDTVEIGRIPQPASFGEIGLLLDEPRTASVVAVEHLLALKFGAKSFEVMFQKIPEFGVALSSGLAFRLQQVSGKVPLPDYDVRKGIPRADVVNLLPVELCQRHRVLPLEVDGNVLTLGLVDDPARHVIRAVREHAPGMELHTVRLDVGFFNEVMQAHAGVAGWTAKEAEAAPAAARPAGRSPRLDAMLERMVAEGASDLHLSAGHRPHWRIDGDMQEIADAPVLGPAEVRDLLEPAMETRHREEFADHDTDFAYSSPVARFRVNLFRDNAGVGAVLRLIPSKVLTLEQLGLPPVLKTLCEIPKGLVLVTGPTGSGKSTTLAAMIDHIKSTRKLHIVTIEDPIEFVHESRLSLINQREVGGHTRSFARALRAALREDPDVILVGEMRDVETISLTLEAANTGHLVLATLHTNNAVSAVDRVVDQFPGDQQDQARSVLADVLRGVVAQTLCKKIGGGRLAVLEVLVGTLAVQNLVREAKTVQLPGIMQTSKALGMSLLNDELARLIEGKKVTMEEALAAAVDKEDLQKRFRSGVTLAGEAPDFERFRVMAVNPNSPGAEAGLLRGDVLIEIDGKPAKEHTLDDVRHVFRSEGRHALLVERAGKRVKLTLEIRGRF
jgi:twitching motility protein PilT